MTLEIRCVECGWLDPKLWSSYDKCNCNHYFRDPEYLKHVENSTIQLIFWASGEFGQSEHVRLSDSKTR